MRQVRQWLIRLTTSLTRRHDETRLREVINSKKPGATVKLEIYRGKNKQSVDVKLGKLPANAELVLQVAGLADLIDHRVDGVVAKQRGLPGKPAPDTFLAAAADLDVPKEQAVVFEDALAGVAAGRAGGFGFVVGVDRLGQARELREHGADVVVADLADLLGSDPVEAAR